MTIDQCYSEIDKSNFYLGLISQVYRGNSLIQVENLSLLNHRKIRLETLIPNTINFFVVIDNVQGLFIGEVYQSRVNSSDSVHELMNNGKKENIYPEISVDVIGLLSDDNRFKLAGFKTVGITDKVYIANKELVQKYLESVEINTYFMDKDKKKFQPKLDKLAKIGSFESEYLSLQPNTLFDRHLMAIGTTNSGKSTSALSVLDKLVISKHKVLLIDPTGKYKNSFKDDEMTKLTLGTDTVLPIGKISFRQWSMIFQTNDGTQDTILSKNEAEIQKLLENELVTSQIIGQTAIHEKLIDEIIAEYYVSDFEKREYFKNELLFKEFFTLFQKLNIYKEILKRIDTEKYNKLKSSKDIAQLQRMNDLRNIFAHGTIVHGETPSEMIIYSSKGSLNVANARKEFWEVVIPAVYKIRNEFFGE